MIKNAKQLTLTKKIIAEFATTIEQLKTENSTLSPLLARAQIEALICQQKELVHQAEQYERLLSGDFAVIDVEDINDLPKALIMSRISLGLTQKDLAQRLGMKEQQIQRYENTEYSAASFAKLASIIEALGLKISQDILLPVTGASSTFKM
ncbi:MAG: DNA-binding XRE family transcriptional regulator [Phenylobacterium sp.]|jgi:DNA-binding XRE family transcriptional regulator